MRIAVTIAGGVSMGTFEAGAVQEILLALSRTASDKNRNQIDILTGASAGSMTAAMIALELRDGAKRYAAPDDSLLPGSRLYRAWVELADWKFLTQMAGDDPDSILGDRALLEIARQTLQLAGDARHPACPDRVCLGMALDNLNGIPYTLSKAVRSSAPAPLGDYSYMTIFHRDQIRFSLDTRAAWPMRSIQEAALASGAFPAAFPHRVLLRDLADYTGSDFLPAPPGVTQQAFAYSDGGVFDNEPLGFARDLATPIDEDSPEDRLYILIDPNVDTQRNDPNFGLDGTQRKSVDLIKGLLHLVGVIKEQAAVRDWIRAMKVNNELAWSYDALKTLVPLINIAAADVPNVLRPKALAIARDRWQDDDADQRVAHEIDSWKRWLGSPEAKDWGITADSDATLDAWAYALFLFEIGTGLRGKEHMNVLYINPSETFHLRGQGLFAFAGFFDRRWRDADYIAGRFAARQALQSVPNLMGYETARYGAALQPIPTPTSEQPPLPEEALGTLAAMVVKRLEPYIDKLVKNDHLFDGWDWFNREERKVLEKVLTAIIRRGLIAQGRLDS